MTRRQRIIVAGLVTALCGLRTAAATAQTALPPGAVYQTYGSFRYLRATDPLTDEVMESVATDGADDSDGISLMIVCAGTTLAAVLQTTYMGGDSNDRIRVQYRFDSDPASEMEDWALLNGNRTALGSTRFTEAIFSSGRRANRMVLRIVDPLDSEHVIETFPLNGLAQALSRLTCRTSP